MKRASSQSLGKFFELSDLEDEVNDKGKALEDKYNNRNIMTDIAHKVASLTTHKREPLRRREDFAREKHGLWTNEQKARAARLEKQLKARCALEELIEQQLNYFQAHYNRVMIPTRFEDVSQLLMPKGSPAHELAALTWVGDWRPSAILDLLRSLCPSLSDSSGVEQILPQLVKEIRIEEAVIDEEMVEIQSNCVVHLPFGPSKSPTKRPALYSIRSEFEKIHRVITKAQTLRLKALELVVKKVLSQTDAAEFLVAFAGIQDSIHQFTTQCRLQKGSTSQPHKALVSSICGGKNAKNPRVLKFFEEGNSAVSSKKDERLENLLDNQL